VILTARTLARGGAAAQALAEEGLDVAFKPLDVADEASVRRLAAELRQEYGRLDVLVNNAGAFADWAEMPSSADLMAAHAVFETNLFGAWRACQAFLPLLRESAHGRIVNVSSGAGSHGDTQFGLATNGGATASYGVSKAALNALTVKLAAELQGDSILANAVCPGLTATYAGAEAMGARPIPEGAASVVWAVTLADDGPTGGFFRGGRPLPW
jgi:NAD(P)-dependent dehydrogenase (short-subunit alcohol dehydrogenase family)